MANKHSRDFGLNGKGSRPRTDTSSKAFQESYEQIHWSSEDRRGTWKTEWLLLNGYAPNKGKWTKRFK